MAESKTFVIAGRQPQFDQLQNRLARALAGKPQLVFVTGEAGIGKTTLLREFCRQMQEKNDSLIVAWGECSDVLGRGDPYMPFKDIMGLLTGDVNSERAERLLINQVNAKRLREFLVISGEILFNVGGDLIDIFVPGSGLLGRAVSMVGTALNIGWVNKLKERLGNPNLKANFRPEQIFEQYGRVLIQLAKKRPLLLVLDDLHWADADTLALLFYLSRRFQQGPQLPLLLIGTYRPTEIEKIGVAETGALTKVVDEVRRYGENVIIDLGSTLEGQAGRAFVDAWLDTEPNRYGEDFRKLLARRTEGHALFTVELLKALEERGVLAKDSAGCWYAAKAVTFDELPDRVEAVIAERIRRLESDLREILKCGSIEGEEFTAQVVAHVKEIQERGLVMRLSQELDHEARLVRASAAIEVNHRRLYRFQFRHALFQFYLYQQAGQFEREILHCEVGEALEDLYGQEADKIAAELAQHFELGHIPEKAIGYYRKAGDQALKQFANEQASAMYSRALVLLAGTNGDVALQFDLLRGRAESYNRMGKRQEQKEDLNALSALAQQHQDDVWIAMVQNLLAEYYERTGQHTLAVKTAGAGREAARRAGNKALECESLCRLASAYYWIDSESARENAWATVEIARQIGDRWYEARALSIYGLNGRELGDYESARTHLLEALELARVIGDRWCEMDALAALGIINGDSGDHVAALEYCQQSLTIARAMGDRWSESDVMYDLSNILSLSGHYSDALACVDEAIQIAREVENRWGEANLIRILGQVYSLLGDYQTAQQHLEESQKAAQDLQNTSMVALSALRLSSVHRELGYLTMAQACATQALDLFQEAKWEPAWYLALSEMGRLLEILGQIEQSRENYSRALEFARTMKLDVRVIGEQANLARVNLLLGNLDSAGQIAKEVWIWIKEGGLERLPDPILVCLSCAQVLQSIGELEPTRAVLDQAYEMLNVRADRIDNLTLRRFYLQNVRTNRDLVATWKSVHSNSSKK